MIGLFQSDILDINSMFRDLATMVHEQGETISMYFSLMLNLDMILKMMTYIFDSTKFARSCYKVLLVICIVVYFAMSL